MNSRWLLLRAPFYPIKGLDARRAMHAGECWTQWLAECTTRSRISHSLACGIVRVRLLSEPNSISLKSFRTQFRDQNCVLPVSFQSATPQISSAKSALPPKARTIIFEAVLHSVLHQSPFDPRCAPIIGTDCHRLQDEQKRVLGAFDGSQSLRMTSTGIVSLAGQQLKDLPSWVSRPSVAPGDIVTMLSMAAV